MARNEEHFVTIQKKFKLFIALSPREMGFFCFGHPAKQFSGSSSHLVHCISNHFFSALTGTRKGSFL
jgi:hypothetical protein